MEHVWALLNLIFCNNQIEKRRLNLLDNYMKSFGILYFDFRSVVGRVVVIGAFGAEGRWFNSTSSRHVGTLDKSFTRNCLYHVMRSYLSAKFDSCNSLLSSVHALLENILRCVRLHIINEN